ncbi:MAG: MlaA family lipoprotein, partial [Pseudomonadales bacterium]
MSYQVSDWVDRNALAPVARGYQKVTPDWLEAGIFNFFTNLRTIDSSVNGFLQGKPKAGATDFARLLINSTLGLGGFFDVAERMGLRFQDEDLGQTLA